MLAAPRGLPPPRQPSNTDNSTVPQFVLPSSEKRRPISDEHAMPAWAAAWKQSDFEGVIAWSREAQDYATMPGRCECGQRLRVAGSGQ